MIFYRLTDIPSKDKNIALTLGTFDGVHLGHRHLIEEMKKKAKTSALITFSTHPVHYFNPNSPLSLLCSFHHKLQLLQTLNIDYLIILPFNEELANQSYDTFIKKVRTYLPFSHLVLGQGASFGKNREGTEENISKLAAAENFTATYIPKKELSNNPLSSKMIRQQIQQGNLKEASSLLGRPYSLYAGFYHEKEKLITDHETASTLCLPPPSTYPIQIFDQKQMHKGELTIQKKEPLLTLSLSAATPLDHYFLELIFKS